jgi:prophage maintenance system killer protein
MRDDELQPNSCDDTQSAGYASAHGDTSGILPSGQGPSPSRAARVGASGIPTLEELKDLNRVIHDDAGQPERYKLDQPAPLQSCLGRAREAYSCAAEDIVRTAAMLAHGIAAAQAFRDGNRRTAYFATQVFLARNGLAHLSAETRDDDTLARYLNQVVENQSRMRPTPGPERFEQLFRRRLKSRTARRIEPGPERSDTSS